MLGLGADAEDVVQDVYLRWQNANIDQLDSPEAWLVTVTTRLSIDRPRAAKGSAKPISAPDDEADGEGRIGGIGSLDENLFLWRKNSAFRRIR